MNIALLLFLHLGAAGTDATHGIELVFPHFRGGGLESSVLRGVLRTGMKKGMATRSRILAWRIPRTEEPGGLQSVGLHRVRHD